MTAFFLRWRMTDREAAEEEAVYRVAGEVTYAKLLSIVGIQAYVSGTR